LAAQVAREFRRIGRHRVGLRVVELTGGTPLPPQALALHRGVHIAVGTPGRVIDHLQRGTLTLSGVATVVLDEADRMLDMGFLPDISRILGESPPKRQTVLFSATFPESVRAVREQFLTNPVEVDLSGGAAAVEIRQVVVQCEADERASVLARCLSQCRPTSALVFCNQRVTIAGVVQALLQQGHPCAALHGDMEQFDRDEVLAQFRNGSVQILVATDVAARGLDVESIQLVANFDLPPQPESYLHRIGRTGRSGRNGLAISMVGSRDEQKLARLESHVGAALERCSPDELPVFNVERAPPLATIRLGAGRKAKLRPGDILGGLTGEGGLPPGEVGRIEIHDQFSYVAVPVARVAQVLAWLEAGRMKGRKVRGVWVRTAE
jgi:ATP-independent RNA helicase DbpA